MQNTGLVCRIHRLRVDISRIRKEKVADSIPEYVWRRPKIMDFPYVTLPTPEVVNR